MKIKKEKRKYLILLVCLISIIYIIQLIQFVSAASIVDDLNGLVDGVVGFFNPFSAKLLGDTPSGELLFAKVLFFIIVLSMVWLALSRIHFFNPDEGAQLWVIWVVSVAVAVLAVRFLTTQDWIQTIILPYSTLGIVIAAGFPFVIYFILINLFLSGPTFKTIRRVAWIFFAIVFLGLYTSRGDIMGSARNIYLYTALVSFVVIFMDGTFQRMIHNMKLERFAARDPARQLIMEQMVRNDSLFANHMIGAAEYQRIRKKLVKDLQLLNR